MSSNCRQTCAKPEIHGSCDVSTIYMGATRCILENVVECRALQHQTTGGTNHVVRSRYLLHVGLCMSSKMSRRHCSSGKPMSGSHRRCMNTGTYIRAVETCLSKEHTMIPGRLYTTSIFRAFQSSNSATRVFQQTRFVRRKKTQERVRRENAKLITRLVRIDHGCRLLHTTVTTRVSPNKTCFL